MVADRCFPAPYCYIGSMAVCRLEEIWKCRNDFHTAAEVALAAAHAVEETEGSQSFADDGLHNSTDIGGQLDDMLPGHRADSQDYNY